MRFNLFNLNGFDFAASTGRGFFASFNSFVPFRFTQNFSPFSFSNTRSFGSFFSNFGFSTTFSQRSSSLWDRFNSISQRSMSRSYTPLFSRPTSYRGGAVSVTPFTGSYSPVVSQAQPKAASMVETVIPKTYTYAMVSANQKQRLKQYGPEFLTKVKQVAKNINCEYQDLLAVMNAESGINHTVQNKAGHHYYGLIQFGEDAARSVGTTTQKLVRMSAVEQLDYVEKYFLLQRRTRGWGNQKLSAAELYALVFAPARAKGNVLYAKSSSPKAYNANKTIDTRFGNNDGVISKNELQNYMNSKRLNENLFLA